MISHFRFLSRHKRTQENVEKEFSPQSGIANSRQFGIARVSL
jgi:hypothetical protein